MEIDWLTERQLKLLEQSDTAVRDAVTIAIAVLIDLYKEIR